MNYHKIPGNPGNRLIYNMTLDSGAINFTNRHTPFTNYFQ